MLYQLSYLGASRTAQGPAERAVYSGLEPSCPPGFALSRFAGRGRFSQVMQRRGLAAWGAPRAIHKILVNRPYSWSSTSSSRAGMT